MCYELALELNSISFAEMTIVAAASAHEVPKEVLDGFWKLSDAKENVRIEAGTKIIEHAKVNALETDRNLQSALYLRFL